MRRIILSLTAALVLVAALLATASRATAAPVADVVGHVDVAIDSDAKIANYSYTADHEQVVILQAWETSELRALKAANPNVKVLMYQNASSASTTASGTGQYSTGVSYQQARSSGWLLKNTSGRPFTFSGENWLYATDIGSRGYAKAWAHNVVSELHSAPWDGVFIDDLNPTIAYHYSVGSVAKYPTNARYAAAMGRFVRTVGPQVRGAGKLAIANIGSWAGYTSTVDPWLRSLSGAMDEEFVKWGTSAGSGYANEATWRTQLHEVELTQSEHKLFIGITHSSADDEQAALFGYATELLAGTGHAIFSMNANYTDATWFSQYNYAIGQPIGPQTVSHGVYERRFADGIALVNPTTASATVDLGGTYSGCGEHGVQRVTIAPHAGLVLVRGTGQPAERALSGRA